MDKLKEKIRLSKRGAVTGLVISFCLAIVGVGVYTFNQTQKEKEIKEETARLENETPLNLPQIKPANADDIANPEVIIANDSMDLLDNNLIVDGSEIELAEEPKPTPITKPEVRFNEKDGMIRPIEGTIIMEYSMEKSIYFKTLDQYKRNPAIVIQATVGSDVIAASRGIVESIEKTPTTGTTVTLDMGNNYHAVYGQLKDIEVQEGQLINQGDLIGLVDEPTKYYALEGTNVYFELIKDGISVNPVEYF